MIRKTVSFAVPEYREKKPFYEAMGYKEVAYKEKGYKAKVTFENNETKEHYHEIKKIENRLNVKGPIFLPIILFVVAAFILLSCFVIAIGRSIRDNVQFDLINNILSYLLPAFILLLMDVIYTFFYFKINRMLMLRPKPTIDEVKKEVEKIRNR